MKGLTYKKVEKNRELYGSNALSKKEKESLLSKLIEGFKDKMIIILLIALAINVIFVFLGQAEWYEAVGIAIAVLIANFVSVFSEYKNENKFQELQDKASEIKCKVYRDGILTEISINDIVVDDIVKLESGDKIPADGIVVDGEVKVDQSTLNGESEEVTKSYNLETKIGAKADLSNEMYVFRGTVVTSGECLMEVKSVGDHTLYGKLNQEMQEETRPSPLKVKLGILADQIATFGKVGAILIAVVYTFVSGISFKSILDAIILAVTIIVMAVPEGLPMMIALVLSMNMGKMLKDNVLVRKINGIETAGGLNILFSDKTGTLTEGRLSVVDIVDANLKPISIKYSLDLQIGLGINNSSQISFGKVIGGNSTDRCLMQHILDNNIDLSGDLHKQLTTSLEPFDSNKKYSTLKYNGYTYIKGAPERVIPLCENVNKDIIESYINLQCEKSMRLIAVACDKELIGIVSIRDNVRPEVRKAVLDVQHAGVQVVMITGDRKETAVAIAKESGIIRCESDLVYTSDELKEMTDEELKIKLPNIRVIARALPTDKSRLVKIAQELDLVVGMTGDGVNDAPALKKADVGFAMGSGTDVSKEAGDIVILDDNFSSIRKAILYGRTIFKSIRKFIIFQLTVNVAAVSLCFIAPLLGIAEPLTIIQILWINLIMDTLAALAFGGEPSLERYLREKPISRKEHILTKNMIVQILEAGIFMAIGSLIILLTNIPNKESFMFAFFIFTTIFNGFNARTEKVNLFEHIGENKKFIGVMSIISIIQIIMITFGGELLRTEPLSLSQWLFVVLLSLLIIVVDLIRKILINK